MKQSGECSARVVSGTASGSGPRYLASSLWAVQQYGPAMALGVRSGLPSWGSAPSRPPIARRLTAGVMAELSVRTASQTAPLARRF
jgi:hypothetical protein